LKNTAAVACKAS